MTLCLDQRLLDVVSEAYRLDLDQVSWLEALAGAAASALDHGLGVMVSTYRHERGRHAFTSPVVTTGGASEAVARACMECDSLLSPEEAVRIYTGTPGLVMVGNFVEAVVGEPFDDWQKYDVMRAAGIADGIAASALDSTGDGVIFLAPLAKRERASPADGGRWAKVLAHVLAGLRLRTLRSVSAGDEGEAVVEPDGRVVHAEGQARSRSALIALREGARAIDRARARAGRSDPDHALSMWKALVSARWSLVDRFDADGRRFLIARRNDPAAAGPAHLTERERQIAAFAAMGHTNEHIAYLLGLAPSTVSTHLRRAMRKLGARRHADLAALFVLPGQPGEAATTGETEAAGSRHGGGSFS